MERIVHNGVQVWPKQARTPVGRFTSFKTKVKFAVRWFVIRAAIAVIATALLGMGYAYSQFESAHTLVAVNVPVTQAEVAPILQKICMAESGCKQFDVSGLPVMHANTNGSVDIGKYQINNKIWGAKAKELNMDILTESGQDSLARWILLNRGSTAWNSSAKGWQ